MPKMPNFGFIAPGQDDEDDEIDYDTPDTGDDDKPYLSITDRATLNQQKLPDVPQTVTLPLSLQGIGTPGLGSGGSSAPIAPNAPISNLSPTVAQFIANQKAGGLNQDPLMQQFLKDQESRQGLVQAKLNADTASNLGAAFNSFAKGTAAPTASPIPEMLDKQNQGMITEADKAADLQRKVTDAIEARKSREGIANFRNQSLGLQRQTLNQARSDKDQENMAKALGDDLDPNKARGGNLGSNQKKVDQAERLEGLINDSQGNVQNLDSRQIEELAIGLNSMLSNSSSPAAAQVKALVPSTIAGNTQKLKEWLLNEPTGLNQKAFIQRMADTVAREKNIAAGQVAKAQTQRLARHSGFKEKYPDRYNSILSSYGLKDPDDEDDEGDDHSGVSSSNEKAVSNKIIVTNGKEHRTIDPADLADAEKDGYRRM